MSSHHSEPRELLAAKINSETARLPWAELVPQFAQGLLLRVSPGLDLVDVALAIACDEVSSVHHWQQQGQLAAVSDDEARLWHAASAELWAVVVKPFVLVQPISASIECGHVPLQ